MLIELLTNFLRLVEDPGQAAALAADPEGFLAANGLGGVTAAELAEALPLAAAELPDGAPVLDRIGPMTDLASASPAEALARAVSDAPATPTWATGELATMGVTASARAREAIANDDAEALQEAIGDLDPAEQEAVAGELRDELLDAGVAADDPLIAVLGGAAAEEPAAPAAEADGNVATGAGGEPAARPEPPEATDHRGPHLEVEDPPPPAAGADELPTDEAPVEEAPVDEIPVGEDPAAPAAAVPTRPPVVRIRYIDTDGDRKADIVDLVVDGVVVQRRFIDTDDDVDGSIPDQVIDSLDESRYRSPAEKAGELPTDPLDPVGRTVPPDFFDPRIVDVAGRLGPEQPIALPRFGPVPGEVIGEEVLGVPLAAGEVVGEEADGVAVRPEVAGRQLIDTDGDGQADKLQELDEHGRVIDEIELSPGDDPDGTIPDVAYAYFREGFGPVRVDRAPEPHDIGDRLGPVRPIDLPSGIGALRGTRPAAPPASRDDAAGADSAGAVSLGDEGHVSAEFVVSRPDDVLTVPDPDPDPAPDPQPEPEPEAEAEAEADPDLDLDPVPEPEGFDD